MPGLRWCAFLLVACGACASGFSDPSWNKRAAFLRAELRAFERYQEQHFAEYGRYASRIGSDDFFHRPGTTVIYASASAGWSAAIYHIEYPDRGCAMRRGNVSVAKTRAGKTVTSDAIECD